MRSRHSANHYTVSQPDIVTMQAHSDSFMQHPMRGDDGYVALLRTARGVIPCVTNVMIFVIITLTIPMRPSVAELLPAGHGAIAAFIAGPPYRHRDVSGRLPHDRSVLCHRPRTTQRLPAAWFGDIAVRDITRGPLSDGFGRGRPLTWLAILRLFGAMRRAPRGCPLAPHRAHGIGTVGWFAVGRERTNGVTMRTDGAPRGIALLRCCGLPGEMIADLCRPRS
jgi:hypothetical protein